MSTIPLKTCDHKWCSNRFPEHYVSNTCADIHLPPFLGRFVPQVRDAIRAIRRTFLRLHKRFV